MNNKNQNIFRIIVLFLSLLTICGTHCTRRMFTDEALKRILFPEPLDKDAQQDLVFSLGTQEEYKHYLPAVLQLGIESVIRQQELVRKSVRVVILNGMLSQERMNTDFRAFLSENNRQLSENIIKMIAVQTMIETDVEETFLRMKQEARQSDIPPARLEKETQRIIRKYEYPDYPELVRNTVKGKFTWCMDHKNYLKLSISQSLFMMGKDVEKTFLRMIQEAGESDIPPARLEEETERIIKQYEDSDCSPELVRNTVKDKFAWCMVYENYRKLLTVQSLIDESAHI